MGKVYGKVSGNSLYYQLSSVAQSHPTLGPHGLCSMPGFPVHHQLPEPTQIHVHRVGDAIQPFHPRSPLLLPSSIIPSTRVFSNESVLHIKWPKYWTFSFNINPSNEHSGLISFQDGLVGSPQFKSISSLALSFLYSPALTSIHDHWKNHSLD